MAEPLTPEEEAKLRHVTDMGGYLIASHCRRLWATLDAARAAAPALDVERLARAMHEVICFNAEHGDTETDPCIGVNFAAALAARAATPDPVGLREAFIWYDERTAQNVVAAKDYEALRLATPAPLDVELREEVESLRERLAALSEGDAALRDAFEAVRNGGRYPTKDEIVDAYRAGLLMYRPAATPAPLDERMLRWIVAKSGITEPNPPICDWACAQCTIGKLDPPTVDGFRCVPHEAAARLAATDPIPYDKADHAAREGVPESDL